MEPDEKDLWEIVEQLKKRVETLEYQNKEIEFQLQKLSEIALTADKYHQKLRSETIRHEL